MQFKLKKPLEDCLKFDIKFAKIVKQNKDYGDFTKLDETRSKIDTVDQDEWTKIRKISNMYEAPFFKPNKKIISRAFYKIWEIICENKIDCDTETLHLCEAPGGFIQACLKYKKEKYKDVKTCHTISLVSSQDNSPVYSQELIKNNNVNIVDKYNGDLYNLRTIIHLNTMFKDTVLGFITADGGITDNGDFNNKEMLHNNLIFNQVFLGCCLLSDFGCFVIKIFDIFTDITVHIMYLLNFLFEEVIISKPLTSRPTNSEKYLICKGFCKEKFSTEIKNNLFRCISYARSNDVSTVSLLKLPSSFSCQIRSYNNTFVENQIMYIEKNLSIIDKKRESVLDIKNFINKKKIYGKTWMKKYDI